MLAIILSKKVCGKKELQSNFLIGAAIFDLASAARPIFGPAKIETLTLQKQILSNSSLKLHCFKSHNVEVKMSVSAAIFDLASAVRPILGPAKIETYPKKTNFEQQ